jgi:hypothetical protein
VLSHIDHPDHERKLPAVLKEDMGMVGGQFRPQRRLGEVPLPWKR